MVGSEKETSLNIGPKLEARVKWEIMHTSIISTGSGPI